MKLPNHTDAFIPQEKIIGYLLSSTHHEGRSKAAFFTRYGFSVWHWEDLDAALRRYAADHDVVRLDDSPFGTRPIIEGILTAPDGRAPFVRSVWFIEIGECVPRLVTSYPLRRRLP